MTENSECVRAVGIFVYFEWSHELNQEQDVEQELQITAKSEKVKSVPAQEFEKMNEELKKVLVQKNNLEDLLKSGKVKVGVLDSELNKLKEKFKGRKVHPKISLKTLHLK